MQVELQADIADASPAETYSVLTAPGTSRQTAAAGRAEPWLSETPSADNATIFRNIRRIMSREVVEDDHKGFQRVRVEHLAEWRFLRVFHGTFTTALEVTQDERAGTVSCWSYVSASRWLSGTQD